MKIIVKPRGVYVVMPQWSGESVVRSGKLAFEHCDRIYVSPHIVALAKRQAAYFPTGFLDDLLPTYSRQRFAVLRVAGAGSCRAMIS